MNPLDQYPAARKALYTAQWIVNGVLVVAGTVFLATDTATEDLPQWYVLALAIAPVLWTYLGRTAQQNVQSYRDVVEGDAPAPPPEGGRTDVLTAALVVLVVVVVLVILL